MAEKKRDLKLQVSRDLTDAVQMTLEDALDAGIDLDDVSDEGKFTAKRKNISEGLDELIALKSQGAVIPGQSLTNSPEQPYAWEQPAEFSNPREGLNDILNSLLTAEAVKVIAQALSGGASIGDLAISIVYAKFVEGKINPDVMLLLVEPVMYVLMAIGEEAKINYNIDGDDVNEPIGDEIKEKLAEAEDMFQQIKSGAISKVREGAVPSEIKEQITEADVPSLLGRTDEQQDESLLERREE